MNNLPKNNRDIAKDLVGSISKIANLLFLVNSNKTIAVYRSNLVWSMSNLLETLSGFLFECSVDPESELYDEFLYESEYENLDYVQDFVKKLSTYILTDCQNIPYSALAVRCQSIVCFLDDLNKRAHH
jgi:hypothetical protein